MMLDVGGTGTVPPEETERTQENSGELAPLQDIHGRVIGVVAVPVHLQPEKPLSLELPLTLKPEELQVRLEEFLTAAAHWNIKEILAALSDHFDQLQFRLMVLSLSKSGLKRDLRAKSDSIHRKLDPAQAAIHQAIEVYGVAGFRKALAAYEQAESKLGAMPPWRRFLAISTRRAKRYATEVIPREVLQHKIGVEFLGGAIQTKFLPGSQGANEIEEMKSLQAVTDEMNREEEDLNEKIQDVERVRIDLESMKFPAPN